MNDQERREERKQVNQYVRLADREIAMALSQINRSQIPYKLRGNINVRLMNARRQLTYVCDTTIPPNMPKSHDPNESFDQDRGRSS